MAYSGTTAASSLRNPPILLNRPMAVLSSTLAVIGSTGGTVPVVATRDLGGTGIWIYSSFDTGAAQQAVGYFTDGQQLGMRTGDVLISVWSGTFGTSPSAIQVGCIVTTNSSAGFNVAAGAAIQSS